ncbi:MAG: divalent-cation tolerance protein CutA [Alphaproteobacteria bacterium]
MSNEFMVYVTCKDKEEAKAIASAVIEKRLAACANIFSPHESLYWWEGSVQNEQEVAMVLKTPKERYHELEAAIKDFHSYEVPCIVAIPLENGYNPFLQWINDQTNSGA